jgi:hypothetical protein
MPSATTATVKNVKRSKSGKNASVATSANVLTNVNDAVSESVVKNVSDAVSESDMKINRWIFKSVGVIKSISTTIKSVITTMAIIAIKDMLKRVAMNEKIKDAQETERSNIHAAKVA